MNDRIKRLREQSLNAEPRISTERAMLITEFYKSDICRKASIPERRALAFKHILSNKSIFILDDELIVGERGPAPKVVPTYPEINLHSLEDLHVLNTRPKVWFRVNDETKELYKDIVIPFWEGKTNREKIFSNVDKSWIDAYEAGVFTEFQEQRAPGHTVLGKKMFNKGFLDLKNEVKDSIANLDFVNDPDADNKHEELKAMDITADAIILFASRHADELERLAQNEKTENRKLELIQLASICRKVPADAPETFHEALQHYWFIHVGVISEVNPWDSFNPGRLDQHLYPFYKKEIDEGTLSKEIQKKEPLNYCQRFGSSSIIILHLLKLG